MSPLGPTCGTQVQICVRRFIAYSGDVGYEIQVWPSLVEASASNGIITITKFYRTYENTNHGGKEQRATCLAGRLSRFNGCLLYRIQVMSERKPMMKTLYVFASRNGIRSLWAGISASILRQSTYSTARFGLYNYFTRTLKQSHGVKNLSAPSTIACAGLAGGLAGVLGNPTEIVLVRMCADGAKPAAQRYSYAHALDGIIRVAREEGVNAFSKGMGPNIARSVLMNVSQIAVYTSAKASLLSNSTPNLKDGVSVHIAASLAAGTVATTVCAPADVLKSRVQNAAAVGGKSTGLVQVVTESVKKEGVRFLMKGWLPAWLRLTPNTVLMFIFMEQLSKLAKVTR
ncbi:hypothetical protein VF21_09880 [Pseudogymnoascus sp. 05NY08]|nr:hypothetical protein VF21_09880 [Pseudogymnoascus sp. 05NY08]